jgi:hypothetical protein
MKVSGRLAAALLAAVTTVAIGGTPAAAAPPGNDTYGGAETIAALPFATTLDTTEATTDSDDDELNAECGAPAMDASVWYSYTATADGVLLADASGSDYSAGVFIATGAPGSFVVQACGPGGVGWEAMAGETYYIVVIDDQDDGGGNGGMMQLSVDEAPPVPSLEVTVNRTGTFNARTGTATISGTATCSSDAEFAFVEAMVEQRVGRFIIRGYGGAEILCDGTEQAWSFEVIGENGLFKGGRALSVTYAAACNIGGCAEYYDEVQVRLTGKKVATSVGRGR